MKRTTSEYTIRKKGDNYGLYFYGELLEVFATRKTAEKWKEISEQERRAVSLRRTGALAPE